MKLAIEIIHVEHNLPDNKMPELYKAIQDMQEIILQYCKMGVKPGLREWVISKESDYIVEITSITYCDFKIMYECKLLSQ